ncbi:hypothetical protein DMA11_21980 [Marinilabiliaceae bacterium JC017]|nr:hypothetical protein DMA11_21980 [Marinilabiliaceae bacterium JC017]
MEKIDKMKYFKKTVLPFFAFPSYLVQVFFITRSFLEDDGKLWDYLIALVLSLIATYLFFRYIMLPYLYKEKRVDKK